jgi:hypothetical protein
MISTNVYPAAWNGLTKVWVQLTTGGAPVLPSFYEMFGDPMFGVEMEIWALDHPDDFGRLFPTGGYGTHGKGVSSVFGDDPGKGIPSGPAIPKDKPDDYPWDPSGGQGDPGFDILVLNDQLDWAEDARKNIEKAVQEKKGIVLIHHSLSDNQDWPWWFEKVTGGLCVLDDRNGKKKSTVTQPVALQVELGEMHPILEGVKPFELTGETAYRGMWWSSEITPLLHTTSSGYDRTVAWIGPGSGTRVVCIQPGGASSTHRSENFRKLVRNSILWCAGRM